MQRHNNPGMENNLPGTPQHRALLRAILAYYEHDPRVRAVAVFGSLGRGTWDAVSDVDLDIVVADDVAIDVHRELRRLCDAVIACGERAALIVPDGDDAADVVFGSLLQLSVRYHPLQTTSPNIVDSLQVLAGELDKATVVAAGLANRRPPSETPQQLLDACVRYAAVADVALRRRRTWITAEVLHRMRQLIMELFARVHGSERAYYAFEAEAPAGLQVRLGATLPGYSLASIRRALLGTMDILQDEITPLTDGTLALTDAHRRVLARIRENQAGLDLYETQR